MPSRSFRRGNHGHLLPSCCLLCLSLTFTTFAYDAGTEANSEAAGTIPGPADSGEGFNEERDDVNYVAMHPGVVSQHDGLSSSVLSSQHKFDNPLTQVVITRTQ